MAFSRYSHVLFLTLVVIISSQYTGVSTQQNNTMPSPQGAQMPQLPLFVEVQSNIGKPGLLFFSLDSKYVFHMNFTIKCDSPETVYTVMVKATESKVAHIMGPSAFNVSCHELKDSIHQNENMEPTSEPTPFIGAIQGEVNMTISTNHIGRSFLLLFAEKINGPNTMPSMFPGSGAPAPGQMMGPKYETQPSGASRDRMSKDASLQPMLEQNSSGSSQGHAQKPRKGPKGMPELPPNVVGKAMIIVMQLPRPIDEIFRIVLYIVIILATIGMGVKVDYVVVKTVLMKPIAPIIGVLCQYLGMPLIAYVVAKSIPQESAAISLGIFTCGIVPGGGASNMYCYLLGGDVSLSVTMTTISSVLALGLIPLWIFTLGSTFKDDTVELKVPYEKIIETLAIVLLPLFAGMIIRYKLPKVAKIISKLLKPVLLVVVMFLLALGIYTNMYIFKMISPMTIAAGCLLPYIGYVLGGFVSFITCRSWITVKTVAIETGIQNVGIAFMIVFLSLPPPDNQLAVVGPASSAIMTPLPLLIFVIIYTIYLRCKNRHKKEEVEENQDLENGNIPKTDMKTPIKKLAQGEGTAAIVLLWRKITGTQPQDDPAGKILNQELEILAPEKEDLVAKQ